VIEHSVERHQPYEHGVEHHLLYVVCIEDAGGSVCDRAWCGASPAICCVCGKWRVKG